MPGTRTRALTVIGVLTLAGAGLAQSTPQIDVKGRIKGSDTAWLDTIETAVLWGNPTLEVEIAVFYNWQAVNGAIALSTCVNSPVVNGWDADLDAAMLLDRPDSAQHPDGRQGRFNFGAQRQQTYTGGVHDTGRLRIAAPNNTQAAPAGGVSIKQNTPAASGTNLDVLPSVLGFRFDITLSLGSIGGNPEYLERTLSADVPLNLVNSFTAYNDPSGTSSDNQRSRLLATDPLLIHFYVPSPGAGALLVGGLGVLAARRRR